VDDENLLTRVTAQSQAIGDASEAILFGHGLHFAQEPRYSLGLSVHNEFLERLVDGGAVGFTLFLVVLAIFAGMALTLTRDSMTAPVDVGLGVGALASMAALAVSMLAVASWTAVPLLEVISWAFFGAVSARYANRDVHPAEET
jgi:O-antigen ligase